jgi:short-subunit dehydrogenase
MDQRLALITGASGGIGLELARLAANDRHNLVIVGRDRDRLEMVAADLHTRYGVGVRAESRDLSSATDISQLCADLTRAGIAIDILINNAGVGLYGSLAEQSPEGVDRMSQLSLTRSRMRSGLARRRNTKIPGATKRSYALEILRSSASCPRISRTGIIPIAVAASLISIGGCRR